MQYKTANATYVQIHDITTMFDIGCPDCIKEELEENGFSQKSLEEALGKDQYRTFPLAFKRQESIQWLAQTDWIINYSTCAGMPLCQLRLLHEGISRASVCAVAAKEGLNLIPKSKVSTTIRDFSDVALKLATMQKSLDLFIEHDFILPEYRIT